MAVKILLALLLVFVSWIYGLILLLRSREYRKDLHASETVFDGASPIWNLNVLNRANYRDGDGQRFWKQLLFATAVQFATTILAMVLIASAL